MGLGQERASGMVNMIRSHDSKPRQRKKMWKEYWQEFPEGTIRVVVATVAFGLGIQVHNVDDVVCRDRQIIEGDQMEHLPAAI